MMSDVLRELKSSYSSSRQNIQSQAETQRSEIARQVREAQTELRKQRSTVEREAEATKSALRAKEAKEQRKRDLPFTKPEELGTKEALKAVEEAKKTAVEEVEAGETEVAELESENLEALAKAEQEALAELETSYQEALAEAKKFEKENIKLATGEYVDIETYKSLTMLQAMKLQELGVEGFNKWMTEVVASLPTKEVDGQTVYDMDQIIGNVNYERIFSEAIDATGAILKTYKEKATLPTITIDGQDVYDLEKISGNSELETLFNKYVHGGEKVLTEYREVSSLPTTEQDGETVYDLEKIAGNAELEALFKKYVTGGYVALEAYKSYQEQVEALSQLPTTQKRLTTVEFALAQKAALDAINEAKKAGLSAKEALKAGAEAFETKFLVYDMDKIVGNAKLEAIFVKYVDGGADILTEYKQIQTTLSLLDSYKSEDGYNLAGFLKDNPSYDTARLVNAGFSEKDVNSALEYNSQPFVASNPWEEYYGAFREATKDYAGRSGYGWWSDPQQYLVQTYTTVSELFKKHPELETLYNTALSWQLGKQEPALSLEAFKANYLAARGISDDDPLKASYESEATSVYTSLYGGWEAFTSSGIELTTNVFSPVRVLYPEVQIKDISALEWSVGAAQLALLAIPVIGISTSVIAKTAITAIEIAAGAVFTTAIVLEWNDMSPLERGISIALTAAIIAPTGIKTIKKGVSTLTSREIATLNRAQKSLTSAWKKLDRVKAKYGTDSPKYTRALRAVETAQAKLKKIVGNVAQSAGKSVKTAITLAKDAGNKARAMQSAINKLNKASLGSRNYARLVAKAQKAIEASRQADKRFLAQFSRLESLSAKELKTLEKKSGISGLKDAVVRVNKAQARLDKAWVAADKIKAKYGTDSPQYLKALQNVAKAQDEFNAALDGFGAKLQVRAGESLATGQAKWDKLILETEGDIAKLRAEIARLEKLKQTPAIKRTLRQLRNQLESKKAQLAEFVEARRAGLSAGVVTKIKKYQVRWETKPPTKDELRDLFNQFKKDFKPTEPTPGLGATKAEPQKAKVKVATKERPLQKQLVLTPVEERVAPRTEPAQKAPKIKSSEKIEYEPGYQKRKYERPDIRDYEDAIIAAIGTTLTGKPIVGTPLEPLIREDIDIFVKPITKTTPDIIRETQEILSDAVKEAIRLRQQGKTNAEIIPAIITYAKNAINPMTEPLAKTALLAQIKPLTKLATKIATRVPPKTKTPRVEPPRLPRYIPIIVTLPDGSKHTLTKEELAGAVGWKQGFIYRAIWPPYGRNDVTHSREPILGIPYFKGAKAAYRSIVKRGGKLPPTITRDMGIMDVYITTGKYGKPQLTFKPDVKQKTKVTGTHRKVKPVPTLSVGR